MELDLELWFYCYAIFYQDFPDSESTIETLLAQGVKSSGDFKDVLEAAKKRDHPNYERLRQFEIEIAGTST